MENLHIKFEFGEAINSKRELLSSQMNLIKVIQKIKKYKELRKSELSNKASLKSKLREIELMMKNLRENLPKTRMPKEEREEVKINIIEKSKNENLEAELKEIKERLARLAA
jgi:uncharacterized protein involved in exopolysaccharide biosynthesis